MSRIAFQLRIQEGRIEEYDQAHLEVWPELLAELQRFGVHDYSIFRRGQELFLYLRVSSWEELLDQLSRSEVNQRWQSKMASLFEPVPSLTKDEPFAMMKEVFYMQGRIPEVRRQAQELRDEE